MFNWQVLASGCRVDLLLVMMWGAVPGQLGLSWYAARRGPAQLSMDAVSARLLLGGCSGYCPAFANSNLELPPLR
jgi:hypothetical protein